MERICGVNPELQHTVSFNPALQNMNFVAPPSVMLNGANQPMFNQ